MQNQTERTEITSPETHNQEEGTAVQFPLEIVFRHMPRSAAVTHTIHRHAVKLQRLDQHIANCHVVIDANGSHQKGNVYQVSVQVNLPGRKTLAAHSSDRNASHEDLYTAVRDVFEDVRRQLKKMVGRKHDPHR